MTDSSGIQRLLGSDVRSRVATVGLGALCLSVFFRFDLPLPAAADGSLHVEAAEVVLLAMWVALLGGLAAQAGGRTAGISLDSVKIPFALFLLVVCVGLVLTGVRAGLGVSLSEPLSAYRAFFLPVVIPFFLAVFRPDAKRSFGILLIYHTTLLALGCAYAALFHDLRADAPLANSIVFSGAIVTLIPVSLLALTIDSVRASSVLRTLAWVNPACTIALTISAGSRVAIVAAVIACAASLALLHARIGLSARTYLLFVLGCLVAVMCITLFSSEYNLSRLGVPVPGGTGAGTGGVVENPSAEGTLSSDSARTALWQAALRQVASDPLGVDGRWLMEFSLGNGLASPHNMPLMVALVLGVQGLVLWCCLFLSFAMRRGRAATLWLGLAGCLSIAFNTFHVALLYPLFSASSWIAVAVIILFADGDSDCASGRAKDV